MNIEWVPVDKCPVCGGKGVPSIENKDPEINDTIHVYFCPFCKCAYHNPRMSQKSMEEYYSTGLYRSDPSRDLTNKAGRLMLAAEVKVLMVDTFCRDVKVNVKRCLDYGCSRGHMVKQLEEHFDGEAIGYDIYRDPEAIINVVDSKDKITGKFDTNSVGRNIRTIRIIKIFRIKVLILIKREWGRANYATFRKFARSASWGYRFR